MTETIFSPYTTEEHLLRSCRGIMQTNKIEYAFRNFCIFNTAANAPYHNKTHTAAMILACNDACLYHGLFGQDRTNLLIAAAYHDFNHSAGELSDCDNIILAEHALWECGKEHSNFDAEKVIDIIRVTQYPYVNEPITLEQKIIRDCDLSMPLLNSNISSKLFHGLAKEMKFESDMKSFGFGVKDFYSKVIMHSEYGRKFIKPFLAECVAVLYKELVK